MAYNLTANLAIQNAARIDLANVDPQRAVRRDPASVFEVIVELELRCGNSGTTPLALFGEYSLRVRDGVSDLLRVRAPSEWLPRAPISERLIIVPNGVSTPTGMSTFLAAYGAGNTQALLNAALTALKTLGVIEQASLAGSAP